jgi:ubiquinone/menaquinone biosynthesis C-methylase UbiE
MVSINLGCGNDYREGWVNVDGNKNVKADIYCNFTDKLPFTDNYADEILLDNVLEHIESNKYLMFMEELWRVAKPNAKITIYVPHYSGMYAFKHPTHYMYFGVGSMDIFNPEDVFTGERYSLARFELKEEKLLFFHHSLQTMPGLSKLPINWIFNICRPWKQIMEKFCIFGYDEIKYVIEVVK